MRLKFLFFPIILVVSVAIFSGFIWPEIGNVKRANEDGIMKKTELQAVNEKQMAIESIGKEISGNVDGENVVNAYLPKDKVEERIISGINYLASDANVSLVNISLGSAKNAAVPANNSVYDTNAAAAFVGLENSGAASIDPATGKAISNDVSLMQSTTANISLVGDYEKIRIFLDSLQRMPILNTIKSLSISKQAGEIKEAEGAGAPDSTLLVNVDVDFGYLSVAKVGGVQLEKFNADLDGETIKALEEYISQKSQPVGSENDVKGKTNPFLTN